MTLFWFLKKKISCCVLDQTSCAAFVEANLFCYFGIGGTPVHGNGVEDFEAEQRTEVGCVMMLCLLAGMWKKGGKGVATAIAIH